MLNNVMTIIKKMDISEEDDFKKEMNKVINKAMKDKTTVKNTKEPKEAKELTPYQQFVKDKMPEVKDQYEPKERMKAIAELWKEHKEYSSE